MRVDTVTKLDVPQYKKIAFVKTLIEMEKRSKEPLRNFKPHKGQEKVFNLNWKDKKIVVMLGGNRSGKTHAGAVIAAKLALGQFENGWKQGPLKIWLVALSFEMAEKILWEEKLKQLIPARLIKKTPSFASNGDKTLTLTNGSTIEFKSCEQGEEKFQGASVDYIHFDEEPPVQIYKECLARTVDCGGKLLFTMTPTKGFSWTHEKLFMASQEDDTIAIFKMSTYDNAENLKGSEIEKLEKLYTDEERKMRLFGDFINLGDRNIFDESILTRAFNTINAGRNPFVCDILYGQLVESSNGGLRVWEEPQKGSYYIASCDASEGASKESDPSVFSVWKINSIQADTGIVYGLSQVAEYRQWFGLEEIGPTYLSLMRLFNNAFGIVEKQSYGVAVLSYLVQEGYQNLYVQTKQDGSFKDGMIAQSFGFYTGYQSKHQLIANARDLLTKDVQVEENVLRPLIQIQSNELWQEMSFYIEKVSKTGTRKITASTGHDDRVIAMMLALEAFKSEQWKGCMATYERMERKKYELVGGYGKKKTPLQYFTSL